MAYDMACQQFDENVTLTNRVDDPRNWNLNAGLFNLTEALSQDSEQIRRALVDISNRLANMETSK